MVSLLLGSLHVSFQDRIRRDGQRLVGVDTQLTNSKLPESVIFSKVEEGECGKQKVVLEMQDRPLGDIRSILFWDSQQKALLDSLKKMESTVIIGDYGVGKTVVLTAAAREFADFT